MPASRITHVNLRPKPPYEVINDVEERDDESEAQVSVQVIKVVQPGVDVEARWVKTGGKLVFGYKQHTLVDDDGLVIASRDHCRQ